MHASLLSARPPAPLPADVRREPTLAEADDSGSFRELLLAVEHGVRSGHALARQQRQAAAGSLPTATVHRPSLLPTSPGGAVAPESRDPETAYGADATRSHENESAQPDRLADAVDADPLASASSAIAADPGNDASDPTSPATAAGMHDEPEPEDEGLPSAKDEAGQGVGAQLGSLSLQTASLPIGSAASDAETGTAVGRLSSSIPQQAIAVDAADPAAAPVPEPLASPASATAEPARVVAHTVAEPVRWQPVATPVVFFEPATGTAAERVPAANSTQPTAAAVAVAGQPAAAGIASALTAAAPVTQAAPQTSAMAAAVPLDVDDMQTSPLPAPLTGDPTSSDSGDPSGGGAGEPGSDLARGFASQLAATAHSATHKTAASLADGLAGKLAAVAQVTRQLDRAARAGVQRVEIALEPEALGRVEVQLEFGRDGQVSALFVIDTKEAYDALRSDARTLERALSDAGVNSGSLSFSLREQAAGSGNGFAHSGSGRSHRTGGDTNAPLSPTAVPQSAADAEPSGRLDIRA